MLLSSSSLLLLSVIAVTVLLASSLLTIFGVCAYRLWFHPLAKYPGPFWSKITNLYPAYHSWKGDLHLDIWRCHQCYGPYVRYGPDRLVFNTAIALKDIHSHGKNLQKCKGYLTMMHRVPNTITQLDKTLHAKQRRILSHGFSDAATRTYDKVIAGHADNFCRHLMQDLSQSLLPDGTKSDSQWSSPKDMARWCDYVAFDIMLDIVYDSKSDMVNKPDNRPLLDAIAKSNIRVGIMMPLYYLKNSLLDRYLFSSCIVARYMFLAFIKALLQNKKDQKAIGTYRQSVYSILMDSHDGKGLGPNEIAAESTNLIVAGSDTTSTVLAAFFFYVSRNPTVYNNVTTEIRSKIASSSDLQNRTIINSCKYLRACIDESLRMAPPVASALFREVESPGAVVSSHLLPSGIDIGTGIYSIHHNPIYFSDPFAFSPERWLLKSDGSNREAVECAQSAFTPFSLGPRSCVGRSLALMELTSVLAHVLWKCDLRITEGDEGRVGEGEAGKEWGRHRVGEFQLYDHLTVAKEGPVLQFRRRA